MARLAGQPFVSEKSPAAGPVISMVLIDTVLAMELLRVNVCAGVMVATAEEKVRLDGEKLRLVGIWRYS